MPVTSPEKPDRKRLSSASRAAGVCESAAREKVQFPSGDTICAAWHYPGVNGGCVIMAGGFAVTKEPATDLFAARFHAAGFSVLAFDYRRLGESGGQPRQLVRIGEQLADWDAAITFARTFPDVDPTKIAIWGFSASGGHVLAVAASHPELAAAIAQTPNADGLAMMLDAVHYQTQIALLRLTGRAIRDAVRGLFGREPLLIPLTGEPGTVACVTTSDARDTERALDPESRYPDWRREVAARSAVRIGFYRPKRHASRIRCPLLTLVCDEDRTALPGPAIRAGERAARGEVVRIPGGHYQPFLEGHERAVEIQLSFLREHQLGRARPDDASTLAAADGTAT